MPSRIQADLRANIKGVYQPKVDKETFRESVKWLESFRESSDAWDTCVSILAGSNSGLKASEAAPVRTRAARKADEDNTTTTALDEDSDLLFFAAQSLSARAVQLPQAEDVLADLMLCAQQRRDAPDPVVAHISLAIAATIFWIYAKGETTNTLLEFLDPIRTQTNYIIQCFISLCELVVDARFPAAPEVPRIAKERLFPVAEELFAILHEASSAAAIDAPSPSGIACAKAASAWFCMALGVARAEPEALSPQINAWLSRPDGFVADLGLWMANPYISPQALDAFCTIVEHSQHILCDLVVATRLIDCLNRVAAQIQVETSLWSADVLARTFIVGTDSCSVSIIPSLLFTVDRDSADCQNVLTMLIGCLNIHDYELKRIALQPYCYLVNHHNELVKQAGTDPTLAAIVTTRQALLESLLMPAARWIYTNGLPFPDGQQETLDFEAWFKFRDKCCQLLTEALPILGYSFILQSAGGDFEDCVTAATRSPNTFIPWTRIEACLTALASAAPRAPAGQDTYIPTALDILPQLHYPDELVEGLLLRAAAARLVLWTARYVGAHRKFFTELFALCEQFLIFIVSCSGRIDRETGFGRYVAHCEASMAETILAMCNAATPPGASERREAELTTVDLHHCLNRLMRLQLEEGLSLAPRCALIMASSAILACMSDSERHDLRQKLIIGLRDRFQALARERGVDSRSTREACKLLLICIQSLPTRSHPRCPQITDLDEINDQLIGQNQLLEDLQTHWGIVEDLFDKVGCREFGAEAISLCIVTILSQTRRLVCQTSLFARCMELYQRALDRPSVYYLGAIRDVVRIFASFMTTNVKVALQKVLKGTLDKATVYIRGEEIISDHPDLVGMTLDVLNVSLQSAPSAAIILAEEDIAPLIDRLIQITGRCAHPKVQLTTSHFLYRLVCWANPHPSLTDIPEWVESRYDATVKDQMVTRWTEAIQECKATATKILSEERLKALVGGTFSELSSHTQNNPDWIETIGGIMLRLLENAETNRIVDECMTAVLTLPDDGAVNLFGALGKERYEKLVDHLKKGGDGSSYFALLSEVVYRARAVRKLESGTLDTRSHTTLRSGRTRR